MNGFQSGLSSWCADNYYLCDTGGVAHAEHPPLNALLAQNLPPWELSRLVGAVRTYEAGVAVLENPAATRVVMEALMRQVALMCSRSLSFLYSNSATAAALAGEELLELALDHPRVPRSALEHLGGMRSCSPEALLVLVSHPRASDMLRLNLLLSTRTGSNSSLLREIIGGSSTLARVAAGVLPIRTEWELRELRKVSRTLLSQTQLSHERALPLLDVLPAELGLPPEQLLPVIRSLM